MLRDVFKRGAPNDLENGFDVDAVRLANAEWHLAKSGAAANHAHVIGRQFRTAVAALASHVCKVVGDGSLEQMRRIATSAVVACVADLKSGTNFAVRQFVRNAVRAELFAAIFEGSVTGAAATTAPFPTLVGCAPIHFGPEALNGCAVHSLIIS